MLFTNEMDDGVLKDILSSLFGEEKKEYSERVKKSLFWMLRSAEKAKIFDNGLIKHGYSTNPYGEIFESVSEAIFNLIGETVPQFEDSVTHFILHADAITDDMKLSILFREYEKNRPAK